MYTIYIYILDTLADWEIGHISAELHSKRFFKKDAKDIAVKTVGCSKEAIKTMGGMSIIPDCQIDDIEVSENSFLILPGADTWGDSKQGAILHKAEEFLSKGYTVCAICGATVALANLGLLNNRPHTSNGAGFLEMFAPGNYTGSKYYVDAPAVVDNNLITASCTGGLYWAKCILEKLEVFKEDSINAWFNYFSTGKAEYFFALMQSVSDDRK